MKNKTDSYKKPKRFSKKIIASTLVTILVLFVLALLVFNRVSEDTYDGVSDVVSQQQLDAEYSSPGVSRQEIGSEGMNMESSEIPPNGNGIDPIENGTGSGEHIITNSNAEISVEYDEIRNAVNRAQSMVNEYDGHIENREENYSLEENENIYSAITFRIPSENHQDMLDRLDELGNVEKINETARDVSDQVVELDTRIENAESSLDRLREFIADAETTEELLLIEEQINTRQASLEVMISQRDGLLGQSEMSTLRILFTTEAPADAQEHDPVEPIVFNNNAFTDNLMRGWSGIVAATNFTFGAFGLLLPYFPVIALATVFMWLRLKKSRRKASANSSSVETN